MKRLKCSEFKKQANNNNKNKKMTTWVWHQGIQRLFLIIKEQLKCREYFKAYNSRVDEIKREGVTENW